MSDVPRPKCCERDMVIMQNHGGYECQQCKRRVSFFEHVRSLREVKKC